MVEPVLERAGFGRIVGSSPVRQALVLLAMVFTILLTTLGIAYATLRASAEAAIHANLEQRAAGFQVAASPEAMQVLADIDRTAGDIDGAERWYRAVLASLPWHDANRIREVQLRRAMLRVAIGRFAEARVMVDGLLAAHALESGSFVGRCRLVELVVLARSDDRSWAAQLELVRRWADLCDRDVCWLLDQAGQRTTAAGKLERSGWLFTRAAAGYARLGLDREREVVERRAATLRRAR